MMTMDDMRRRRAELAARPEDWDILPTPDYLRMADLVLDIYKGRAGLAANEFKLILGLPTGHVLRTRSFRLWGFAVNRQEVEHAGHAEIRPYDNPDAWFVWLMVGCITPGLARQIPHPLPYILFARDNEKVRTYNFDRLVKKISL